MSITLTDEQVDAIVEGVCDGQHLSERARAAMTDNNPTATVAYYYRLDSVVLVDLVKALPPEMQRRIAQGNEPPGK